MDGEQCIPYDGMYDQEHISQCEWHQEYPSLPMLMPMVMPVSQTGPDDGGQTVFHSTPLGERVHLKTHCGENRNVVACLPVAVATAERMQAIGKPEESSGKRHEKHSAEE